MQCFSDVGAHSDHHIYTLEHLQVHQDHLKASVVRNFKAKICSCGCWFRVCFACWDSCANLCKIRIWSTWFLVQRSHVSCRFAEGFLCVHIKNSFRKKRLKHAFTHRKDIVYTMEWSIVQFKDVVLKVHGQQPSNMVCTLLAMPIGKLIPCVICFHVWSELDIFLKRGHKLDIFTQSYTSCQAITGGLKALIRFCAATQQ